MIPVQFETVDRFRDPRLPAEPHRVCFAIVDGRRAEIAVPTCGISPRVDEALEARLRAFLSSEGIEP